MALVVKKEDENVDEELDPPKLNLKKEVLKIDHHVCLMSSVNELDVQQKGRCTKHNPTTMDIKDIVLHYYQHFRDLGQWNAAVPEPVAEYDRYKIEGYQCKVCKKLFRNRGRKIGVSQGPAQARSSFLFHYAVEHGNLINAMQDIAEVDLNPVLALIAEHNPSMNKFIAGGTDRRFDSEPCTIKISNDWWLNNALSTPTMAAGVRENFNCPFNSRPDCTSKNKDVTELKVHLIFHYLDYWKLSVEEYTSNEAECGECERRIAAGSPEACRSSMICHRALQHGELKLAITQLDPGFDSVLFNRMFQPDQTVQSSDYTQRVKTEVKVEPIEVKLEPDDSETIHEPHELNCNEDVNVKMEQIEVKVEPGLVFNEEIHETHMSAAHQGAKYSCDQCEYVTVHNSSFLKHMAVKHEGKKFACDQCDYVSCYRAGLSYHKASKHGGMEYECDQCEYSATTVIALKRHKACRHDAGEYVCNQCDYIASDRSKLEQHKVSEHDFEIRYPCEQCDYSATTLDTLKEHKTAMHEGSLYPCDQCDYKATYLGHLINHKKTIHEGIRYPCDQCDFKATTKRSLIKHKAALHEISIYHCDQCVYTAKCLSSVEDHKAAAHGGIIFKCDQCDYAGNNMRNLKRHITTKHKGIRYPCDQCDFVTNTVQGLKRHKKCIHEKKRKEMYSSAEEENQSIMKVERKYRVENDGEQKLKKRKKEASSSEEEGSNDS